MNTNLWFRQNWLSLLIAILPLFILMIMYPQLPDEIAGHWNAAGEVDRYDPKWTLFLFPFLTLFILGIIWLAPVIDPKQNAGKFRPVINRIGLGLSIFMLGVFILVIYANLGYPVDIGTFVIMGVLALFIFLGNLFGKLRPNYFIGIRTPWTLESEKVWLKTHRLSGFLWVGGSLIMMLLKLMIPSEQFMIPFLVFVGVISLIPVLYSWWLFQNDKKTQS